jgi:O-antigen/teichoic acid export membrane protein
MEFNSHKVLTNTAWNLINYVSPILLAIVVTPIIVHSMGIRQYGIYIFLSTIISMLGLLDFGISTAVNKYAAEYHGRKDVEGMRKLLGTANTIFSGVGIIGLLTLIIGAFVLSMSSSHIFSDYQAYYIGIIAAGMTFAFTSINGVYGITFVALQRFDISSKIGIISIVVQQISIMALVLCGYSVNAIFLTQCAIAAVAFLVQKSFAQKILHTVPSALLWDATEAIKCYRFGLITFINNISTSSLTYLDRLILPFFLGPSNLTYYSLPGNITMRVPGLSNSLSATLFPMASSLQGTGDTEKLRILYVRSFRLITVVAAAISIAVCAYAYQILEYWISPSFAEKSTVVLIILAATNFILALGGPLSNFLLGLGKLKFLTTVSIVMAVTNTILLLILIPIYGINGAAWAYLLSLFPVAYMFYFTEKHYLSLSERRKYYKKIFLGNLLVSIIIFAFARLAFSHLVHNLIEVLAVAGMTILLYIALYWLFGFFEKEDVGSVRLFTGRILGKKYE